MLSNISHTRRIDVDTNVAVMFNIFRRREYETWSKKQKKTIYVDAFTFVSNVSHYTMFLFRTYQTQFLLSHARTHVRFGL